ncbi:MAG: prepilin-type N-terminal cleavage/methylation domain-containing protein [Candidatus Microsaccharimonas sp.]
MNARKGLQPPTTAGFTAVELLVTLFVAALFLAAGYTLYNAIASRSLDARLSAQADNLAYGYLRRYQGASTNPCTDTIPLNKSPLTGVSGAEGLASPTVTIQITCPVSSNLGISRIRSQVEYRNGSTTEYVQHEMYITN